MTSQEKLKKLLNDARKKSASSDGKREVALALAATTKLTVASALQVLDKPFSSGKIGLKTKADMRVFKETLAQMIPQGRLAIDSIPDETSLTPADIAGLASKLFRTEKASAPLRGAPAVLVKSASAEARAVFEGLLGKAFAQKASDRLVETLQTRLSAGSRRLAANQLQATVLEFNTLNLPTAAAPEALEGASGREGALLHRGQRSARVSESRESFYRLIAPVRSELERLLGPAIRSFRESSDDLGSSSDVCWLNDTLRAVAAPLQLATVAEDPRVARIGIPRALSRELSKTGKTVGAIQYRASQRIDGKGILVAVIDGEVDAAHPALAGRVLQKKNFTKESWGHPDLHGTGVAGIIASGKRALLGMAPAVTIASYKVFATNQADQGTEFDATLAIQQALEDGAMIANCSWGVGLATDPNSREARACDRAWDLGLVLIKSAGNKGPSNGTMTSPANARGIIVVGATDRTGKILEAYSSRGPVAGKLGPDLLAPGGSPLDGILSLIPGGTNGPIGHGTSFAAPHIAGLVALLLEQNPTASPDQIKAALIAKGSPLNPNPQNGCGAGLVIM